MLPPPGGPCRESGGSPNNDQASIHSVTRQHPDPWPSSFSHLSYLIMASAQPTAQPTAQPPAEVEMASEAVVKAPKAKPVKWYDSFILHA